MIDFKSIKIIAHRGIHNNIDIPENSLLAFKKAKELNVPIELDIHITKDNKLVVFHDDNLNRMTGLNKKIKDCTYQELSTLCLVNTKEKIPTLKEVLNLIKGKVLLDIEIKDTKKIKTIVDTLIQELSTYNGSYIIKSFNPIIVHYIKKQYKNISCGLLLTNKYKNNFIKILILNNFTLKYSNPDFLAISKKLIDNKIVKKYKENNPILIWTIDNKEEYKLISSNDYICICNNLPYQNKRI